MLLIGKDTLKVLEPRFDLKKNIGHFLGVGDFHGTVLRESRAGHLMVPLLPDSSWEFHDSFVPSETPGPLVFSTSVTNEAFSVKTNTRITNHTGCHDHVWKRVIAKAPSYFPTFASEEGHCE